MMLSASSNPVLHSSRVLSGDSVTLPLRTVNFRQLKQKSLPISAAYASAPPEREAAESSLSLKLKKATSFYEVLDIRMGATSQEVKSAYRRLARIFHPDVVPVDQKSSSADDFMKIHAAYDTLSDTEKRLSYDRQLLVRRRITGISSTASPTVSRFYGYTGRNWETDQCW